MFKKYSLRGELSRGILDRKQGLAMRLGKEGGAAAALLRNQLTFWSSHPSRGHF